MTVFGSSGMQTEIRLAGGAQGFNWLPIFVAEERKLFEKHGITITFMRMGSLEKATEAVRDGAADLTIGPPEGAVADFIGGGSLRVIASNAVRLPMSLVARPEIRTVSDLRGKKIGTSSLREGTAIYTQVLLAQHGLHYPADYEFAMAGIHTTRWDALKNGEIDCAPQPAPWNFLAEDSGYSRIGEVNEAIPEIIFAAVFGVDAWLKNNGGTIDRFLRALTDAYDFVNDGANEDFCVPIFQRVTTQDDASLARRGFTYMRDMGMWPKGLAVPEKGLKTTIDLMIRAGLLDESRRGDAMGVFDSGYLPKTDR